MERKRNEARKKEGMKREEKDGKVEGAGNVCRRLPRPWTHLYPFSLNVDRTTVGILNTNYETSYAKSSDFDFSSSS